MHRGKFTGRRVAIYTAILCLLFNSDNVITEMYYAEPPRFWVITHRTTWYIEERGQDDHNEALLCREYGC